MNHTNKSRTPFAEHESLHLELWNVCAGRQSDPNAPVTIMCDPELPLLAASSEEEQIWTDGEEESDETQSKWPSYIMAVPPRYGWYL